MAGTPGEESPPVVRPEMAMEVLPEMAMEVLPVVGLKAELEAVSSLL